MKEQTISLAIIRNAVANYMHSEGRGCCERQPDHEEHEKILGKLLDVPMYSDGSGYDFRQFMTRRSP